MEDASVDGEADESGGESPPFSEWIAITIFRSSAGDGVSSEIGRGFTGNRSRIAPETYHRSKENVRVTKFRPSTKLREKFD